MLISVAASRVQTIISVCFSNPYFKLDTGLIQACLVFGLVLVKFMFYLHP